MESLASDEIPYFEVTYLYRDASNYKYWGSFKIRGVLAVDELRPHMLMNDYFVPEAVGIRSLTPSERNDDDHDLHEIIAIEPAVTGPYAFTAADLVMSFQRQNSIGWFS